MRRDDETFDNVEIANLEAKMFALLAADRQHHEDPLSATHEQLMAWRDHRIMTGRAEALEAMSHVVRAAARGDTDEARERLDKTLVWFERGGGQYDPDLTDAIDRTWDTIGNPITVDADAAEPSLSDDAAVNEVCATCHGDGDVWGPVWGAWEDRCYAVQQAWLRDHPNEDWYASDERRALFDEQPDRDEKYLTACDDCDGTGIGASEPTHPDETVVAYLDDDTDGRAGLALDDNEGAHVDGRSNDLDDGDEPVGNDDSKPVERAQRAVLELQGRRALEDQYARERERDDASLDRAFYKAAADVDAWGRPGLSAFDD